MNKEILSENYQCVLSGHNFAYRRSFEGFLFNELTQLRQQPAKNLCSFELLNHAQKKIEASWHIFTTKGVAYSPFRAPFGAIECNPNLPLEVLYFFLNEVENILKNKGIQKITITSYPFSYAPENAALLTHLLLSSAYQISNSELTYHIKIYKEGFEKGLHISEKRRLKKCLDAGFTFEKSNKPDLEQVYEFIKNCRIRKDFPVSLDLKDFKNLFILFPENYKVFVVKDQANIAALTVVVKVNQRILYNFYPADSPDYLSFSPTVLLIKGIYDYAAENKFQLLDLGISTDKGKPNFGLIRFKKNLGAEAGLKLSFEKNFS